jgi:hypothetical protein
MKIQFVSIQLVSTVTPALSQRNATGFAGRRSKQLMENVFMVLLLMHASAGRNAKSQLLKMHCSWDDDVLYIYSFIILSQRLRHNLNLANWQRYFLNYFTMFVIKCTFKVFVGYMFSFTIMYYA